MDDIKSIIMILFMLYLCVLLNSITVEPTWGVYPHSLMYSGQYVAFSSNKSIGYVAPTFNQTIYRSSPVPDSYFSTPPKVVLSLLGFKQFAPANITTAVGWDTRILTITNTTFTVAHNIYGATMAYLNYMYLAYINPDYNSGQYIQNFNSLPFNSSYSIDIPLNSGQSYPDYQKNKIQMKGFLSSYCIIQGNASGMYLNFSMKIKNSTFFTIYIQTNPNSILQNITYYRLGYNRTLIERKTYNDIFRDFYFQLTNNINTANISQFGWASATQFQYRNYLMGTNKINILGNVNGTAVQFFLYYYFAQSLALVDLVFPPYVDNPAKAKYLYGQVFYHATKSCTNASYPFYLQTDRKCYSACPITGFYVDNSSKTCIPCHYSCRTCSQPFEAINCLTCDTNLRQFDNSTLKCLCPIKKYDDGLNMICLSCHTSCLTCLNSSSTMCQSCNSSEFRQFNDPNSDLLGQCLCITGYFQNSTNGLCQKCSLGCLACTQANSTSIACSLCDTAAKFQLNASNKCQCASSYILVGNNCIAQNCGDGIKTVSEECDDNNIKDKDGCSSECKVQTNHVCIDNATISPYSVCYFNGKINLQITSVSKSPYSNQVNTAIKVTAQYINDNFLKDYLTRSPAIILQDIARRMLIQKSKRLLSTNDANLKITFIDYDSVSKILQLTFTYDQSFDITTKQIRFIPSVSTSKQQTKYFYNSPTIYIPLQKVENKFDTIFYSQSQYQKAISFKYAFFVLIAAYWIMSIIFIIIKKANVAMQMMVLVQIVYISLLSQQKLQITFAGLSQFGKYIGGFNIQMLKNYNKCIEINIINLSCNLIDNINLTFFVMVSLVVIYNVLKLINKFLNYQAQKKFIAEQQQKNIIGQNQRNSQIIINQNSTEERSQYVFTQYGETIQDKYYKNQQFISKNVYNILLDSIYFLSFVTVMIWGLSLCFIKEYTVPNGILAGFIGVFYAGMWVFWFLTYSQSNFSFIKAHKKVQKQYGLIIPQNSSMIRPPCRDTKRGNNQKKIEEVPESTSQNQKSNSIVFLKIFFYPIIWLTSLGISIVLALTQATGYISESLIISGSLLFAIIIWYSQLYKQKLHIYRAILNSLLLSAIEVVYIVSQKNNLVGTGAPITTVIYAFLCILFLTNSTSTLYLYSRERKQQKKLKKIYDIQFAKKKSRIYGKNHQKNLSNFSIVYQNYNINRNLSSRTEIVDKKEKRMPNFPKNKSGKSDRKPQTILRKLNLSYKYKTTNNLTNKNSQQYYIQNSLSSNKQKSNILSNPSYKTGTTQTTLLPSQITQRAIPISVSFREKTT